MGGGGGAAAPPPPPPNAMVDPPLTGRGQSGLVQVMQDWFRTDRNWSCKQRAEYLQSKTIFYHKKTRLKPKRATRPIPKRRSLYTTATRPIPKRRPLYATATRPIPKRRRPLYATATRSILKRRPLYATATTQILNLSNLLKGSDIKRTSRITCC